MLFRSPVANAAQCVSAQTSNEITFTVTPQVAQDRVPAAVAPVQHVIVEVTAKEINTNCSSKVAFLDTIVTPESFVAEDYFHILEESYNRNCQRRYAFLMSVDKPLQLKTTNQRVTEGGFVEYTFNVVVITKPVMSLNGPTATKPSI